jgi:hypothetical protein
LIEPSDLEWVCDVGAVKSIDCISDLRPGVMLLLQ